MSSRSSYRWSEPAERNQNPILAHLCRILPPSRQWKVLEIGSGTGQHAVHFATHLPHVEWLASDLIENHQTLNAYFDAAACANVRRPVELDAESLALFDESVDVIYTANTCHIMSWEQAQAMIRNAGRVLGPTGRLIIYGPFNVGGEATSDGNYRFDQMLSQTNPWQGIRNREDVIWQAERAGFSLTHRYDMPANNQLLVLERRKDR
ncbi:MAG: DUF938 domain-containing protein [Gammaproteobacteria bacterium]